MNSNNINIEFNSFSGQLLSYLYRLSANRQDAEDLVHDTYIKVTEQLEKFEGRSSFKTWVFAVATNLARDNRRVKNRWELNAQDLCKEATINSKACENRIVSSFRGQTVNQFDIAEHINYCFSCIAKNLKLEQQIAIILKEFYHFSRKEIAEITGKTEGVVKHLLHDSRKELQTRYQQRCALINKKGPCYQCAELNDYLQGTCDSRQKIKKLELKPENGNKKNLDIRFRLINKINPLEGNGASLEDTILQILRETIKDN